MEYKFILDDGISVYILPENYKGFYIQDNGKSKGFFSRFWYKGDEILYDLDALCVTLYDIFEEKIFDVNEEYLRSVYLMPQGIRRSGLDSDFGLDKDSFKRYFEKSLIELNTIEGKEMKSAVKDKISNLDKMKYKYAYLVDCQSLINTLQELLLGSNSSFIGFYKLLSEVPATIDFCDDYYSISPEGRLVYNMLYSLIIQVNSIFDILTKIVYELENIKDCTTSYKKLASNKILFGKSDMLTKINKEGTIFQKDRLVSIFKSLRNEIVHNATWEMNPKIFFKEEDSILKERCIYLPDFDSDGKLVTYVNRKRFFSDGKKVNEELPSLYLGILGRIENTLLEIIKVFS